MEYLADYAGDRPGRDGAGSRVTWRGVPLAELTYTVVDLETTGLKPEGNGITEVCCLRIVAGRVVGRFSTLVNPGRPIPLFIQRMTGISDAMVRGAPAFGEVIPAFLEFLGATVLVAHHAPFDLSFLNYGLYCHGRPSLCNPVVDTRVLARRLLPDLPRGNLDAVARHLGVSIEGRHRASGDAEATAEVLLRLLALCRGRGIESDAELMTLVSSVRAKGSGEISPPRHQDTKTHRDEPLVSSCLGGNRSGRLAILAERCRAFPEAPGVYLMRTAGGRVLYVGKAVSLRRRVASYFSSRAAARTKRLMGGVESVEHLQLGSELEALLEESRLIKLHQPPFNTLLRSYHDYPFIKIEEGEDYPRLVVTRKVGDDGARYFGPFRSMRGTELVVEVLSRCFRLFDSRCPGRSEGEACLYRQMGRCLAPCLGEEQRARYREAVEEVARLLEARPGELLSELVRRRDAAAERLDFETAALYRDGIDGLGRALARRKLLDPAVEGLNVLAACPSLRPGWAELFVFGAGRLVARARVFPREAGAARDAVQGLLEGVARRWLAGGSRAPVRIDAESLDQVTIISSWLERRGASAGILTLEPGWGTRPLEEIVDRALEAAQAAAGEEDGTNKDIQDKQDENGEGSALAQQR